MAPIRIYSPLARFTGLTLLLLMNSKAPCEGAACPERSVGGALARFIADGALRATKDNKPFAGGPRVSGRKYNRGLSKVRDYAWRRAGALIRQVGGTAKAL